MALENQLIAIAITYGLTYLVIYKKSKILGNMAYFLTSLAMIYYGQTLPSSGNTLVALGVMLTVFSLILLITDYLKTNVSKIQ